MFRPRFRLSLLFILAALVAGVSVWLRQAVVRDRNIRELLATEYARGYINSEASSWNTKLLNYFGAGNPFCDNIAGLFINIDKISASEFLHRYQGVDLGDSLGVLMFELHGYGLNPMKTIPISLSEILLVLRRFSIGG